MEFRLAESEPAKGLTEAAVAGSKRKVYLHEEVVLDDRDIAQVAVVETEQGDVAVEIKFTSEGRKKTARLSEHKKKPIAILVDGKVVSAPILNSGIESDRIQIVGSFTKAEAEKLAKTVNGD